MQAFTVHKGLVAPLDRANVDTDAIIPKQFLKSIKRTGFGPNLFDEWRYLDHGEPGRTRPRAAQPGLRAEPAALRGASILLARRTSAAARRASTRPGRCEQYGFRALIAPSFADIFFNNCFKNGLLPIVLPERRWTAVRRGRRPSRLPLTIDLPRRWSSSPTAASCLRGRSPSASTACSTASTTSA
jgi:3-isopropylmalate/(R)-2-methylmalate dehydratase small subunit